MSLFSLISALISLAAIASFINYRFIKLPTTIGVMLVALVVSLGMIIAGPYSGGFREHAAEMMGQIDFNQTVLHGLLAFLLFAGAIHVKLEDLAHEWLTILTLAIVGTLASTFIVGFLTRWVFGLIGIDIPLMHALLFGALISPTDPIAVLAIMKSVGAPKQLEIQVGGESLFNDGVGVVIFVVLLELSGMGMGHGGEAGSPGVKEVAILTLKEVGGAIAFGLAAGTIVYQMMKRVDNYQVEVLLTLALAMGGYALADYLHLSAPIAIVVAGVLIGNQGRTFAMSAETQEHVDTFWELADEILNAVLFMLIGLELLVLPIEHRWLFAGGIAIAIVLLARWISVISIMLPLSKVTRQSRGATSVLTWGALRGGISVAMALSLPATDSRNLVLTITYCVVIFSILVQGLTVATVIRRTTGQTEPAISRH